jgi:hypothetical protein
MYNVKGHEDDHRNPTLDIIGYIGSQRIPDVTIRDRTPNSAAHHAADEAKEVEQAANQWDRSISKNWFAMISLMQDATLFELIDEAIISLSAIHQFRLAFGDDYVDEAIEGVLRKNSLRRYYDTENPLGTNDMSSGSGKRLNGGEDDSKPS